MNKKTLNRMLELANIKPITENKVELSSLELVKKAANDKVYAIVRENSKYFIKVTDKKQNLTESDFDYLGGLANKSKYSYRSFEDATKHLNLMFDELNRLNEGSFTNVLESDIHLLDEKKYVLKLNKPKAKPETDSFDFGSDEESKDSGEDVFDFGSDEESKDSGEDFDFGSDEEKSDEKDKETETTGGDFDFGGESTEDEETEELDDEGLDDELDDEELDDEDSIKSIQKLTGKLGQKLRDTEDISSDMEKWVAKSVLSALDLDNMDTDDKKDIIKTIKKKSEEEDTEEDFDSAEEEFDFGVSDKEEKDSYMDDEPCSHCGGLGHDEFTGEECEWCDGNYEDMSKDSNLMVQTDIDSALSYVSYMKDDKFSEKELNDWLSDMEMSGFGSNNHGTEYDSFMDDVHMYTEEDEETDRGGEPDLSKGEKILLDDLEDESLYGLNPNTTNRYSREPDYIAKKQAIKDMVPHFNKNTGPGYEEKPSENWRKHTIPFDTKAGYSEYDEFMSDITDKLETYEQELAYQDLMDMASEYGFTLSLCHDDKTEDPEESTIYFDIKDGSKKLLKARINSIGYLEIGTMKGKHFIGEPVDSLSDFDETFDEEGKLKDMGPQREKAPEKPGRETETKPGREKRPDTDRPSRRPFNPPPHITPGEEPGPKADRRSYMSEDPTMAPAPAKEPSTTPSEPTTKPGREKRPDTDRPSRRPFNPPPHITPGEEPGPKAEYDVEFS